MVEQQSLFPMEELTFSQEEHPARTSPSPDSARAQVETMVSTEAVQGPLSASTIAAYSARYNPGGSSMRMCRVCLPLTRDGISPTSSWHWDKAGTRMSRGEFLMLNMSEWTAFSVPCRRDGGVCGLSDILESLHNGLRKYFLSRIGCEGIIRRAAKHEKNLPPLLDAGLKYMIGWWGLKESPDQQTQTEVM